MPLVEVSAEGVLRILKRRPSLAIAGIVLLILGFAGGIYLDPRLRASPTVSVSNAPTASASPIITIGGTPQEIAGLQDELTRKNAELQKTQTDLQTTQNDLQKAEGQVASLTTENSTLKGKVKELGDQISKSAGQRNADEAKRKQAFLNISPILTEISNYPSTSCSISHQWRQVIVQSSGCLIFKRRYSLTASIKFATSKKTSETPTSEAPAEEAPTPETCTLHIQPTTGEPTSDFSFPINTVATLQIGQASLKLIYTGASSYNSSTSPFGGPVYTGCIFEVPDE
jgi:Skp family chaperone for outer membrane proteins